MLKHRTSQATISERCFNFLAYFIIYSLVSVGLDRNGPAIESHRKKANVAEKLFAGRPTGICDADRGYNYCQPDCVGAEPTAELFPLVSDRLYPKFFDERFDHFLDEFIPGQRGGEESDGGCATAFARR